MKKKWCILFLIGSLVLSSKTVFGWPQLGQGANIVTQNSGDRATCISVIVSSTSATQVYSSIAKHREILLQNTDTTYSVHCSTFASVTAVSGIKRFILPPFPVGFTTNGTFSIWCVAAPGASSIEIVGEAEWEYRD